MDKWCEYKTGPKWIGRKDIVDFQEIIGNEVQYGTHFLTGLVHINAVVFRTLIIFLVEVVEICKQKGSIPRQCKRRSGTHAFHFFIPLHSF